LSELFQAIRVSRLRFAGTGEGREPERRAGANIGAIGKRL
jgi:hypothetical protein